MINVDGLVDEVAAEVAGAGGTLGAARAAFRVEVSPATAAELVAWAHLDPSRWVRAYVVHPPDVRPSLTVAGLRVVEHPAVGFGRYRLLVEVDQCVRVFEEE